MDSLRDLLEEYYQLNPRIQSDKTVHQYRIAFADFCCAVGKSDPDLSDLNDDNVSRLIRLLSSRGLAAKTINERRGRINAFWAWMAKRGRVSRWPMTTPIPEPVRTPVAWLRPELDRLFAAVERLEGTVGRHRAADWWRALLMVTWDTGERIGALLEVRWDHLSGSWLHVPAEIRKGKRRDMSYQLALDTVTALRRLRNGADTGVMFPWPKNRTYIFLSLGRILKDAGLPSDRRSKFHRLRRSVASHFEAAGGNATKLLGHTARRTTEAYLDPRIVKITQATDLLFRPQADAG